MNRKDIMVIYLIYLYIVLNILSGILIMFVIDKLIPTNKTIRRLKDFRKTARFEEIIGIFGFALLLLNIVTFVVIMVAYVALGIFVHLMRFMAYLDVRFLGLGFWLNFYALRFISYLTLSVTELEKLKLKLSVETLSHITLKICGYKFSKTEKLIHRRKVKACIRIEKDIKIIRNLVVNFTIVIIKDYLENKSNKK